VGRWLLMMLDLFLAALAFGFAVGVLLTLLGRRRY
jgi:hypothetical protein